MVLKGGMHFRIDEHRHAEQKGPQVVLGDDDAGADRQLDGESYLVDRVGGVAGVGGGDVVLQHLGLVSDDITTVKVALEERGNDGVDGVVVQGLVLDGFGIVQTGAVQSAERSGLGRIRLLAAGDGSITEDGSGLHAIHIDGEMVGGGASLLQQSSEASSGLGIALVVTIVDGHLLELLLSGSRHDTVVSFGGGAHLDAVLIDGDRVVVLINVLVLLLVVASLLGGALGLVIGRWAVDLKATESTTLSGSSPSGTGHPVGGSGGSSISSTRGQGFLLSQNTKWVGIPLLGLPGKAGGGLVGSPEP